MTKNKERYKGKSKEYIKEAQTRLKNRRPKYKKKRVIVPTITAIILVVIGIIMAIRVTFYQSTDDAFVKFEYTEIIIQH